VELLAYAVMGGILYGIFFTLVGLGLNLVFGVMRIINLAHGQFIVLGSYAAWMVSHHFGLSPLWAIPVSVAAATIIGWPMYRAVVPRLQRSDDPEMLSFILFFGIGQMLESLTVLMFGADQRSLPDDALGSGNLGAFGQQFPDSWWWAAGISVAALVVLWLYFSRTRFGYATRAVMANREEAVATGIDVRRVSTIAFVAGLALAGIAGVFVPYLLGSVSPDLGDNLTTTAFAIVVIGSLGNPLGTIAGGLVFGLGTMLMQTYYSSWSNVVPYALLLIIVLIRPSGLLGKAVRLA